MKKEEEQLIKELEEQLFQYTYEDKEIDPEQLEKICKLLDVLKPQESPEVKVENSFEEFQAMCKKRDEEEAKAAKRRRVVHYRKLFMGLAASLFLVVTLNVGTYATKQKGFFDVISEGENGIGFLVTGNEIEEESSQSEVKLEKSSEEHFSSWEEVDEKTKNNIIIPKVMPEGFELENIIIYEVDTQKFIRSHYKDETTGKYIMFEITSYDSQVSSTQLFMEGNGEVVKSVTYENADVKFYKLEEDIMCYFFDKNKFYRITSSLPIEDLEEAIGNMIL